MNYIDVKNFRKYEQLFGDNGPAKIGHVNAVIKALNEVAANSGSGGTYLFAGNSSSVSSINWSQANVQELNLDNNPTLSFSNGVLGQTSTLLLRQNQIGQRTITWPSNVIWSGGVAPTMQNLTATGPGEFDPSLVSGTGFNFSVYTTAVQSDGKIIVGGVFTSYNGVSCNRIVRLNTDGSVDFTFNIGNGFTGGGFVSIEKIVIQSNGKILAGGFFTGYDGNSAAGVVRLNSDGTFDNTFSSSISQCYTLALQTDGKILVSGNPGDTLVRLNSDGTLDGTFAANGPDNYLKAITVQPDNKILIGGFFTSYNATSRNYIARINSDGTLDGTFAVPIGADAGVFTIEVQSDGKIIVGGGFGNYGGGNALGIVRLNSNGTVDSSFIIPGAFEGFTSNFVRKVLIQNDGKIIVGGGFTQYVKSGVTTLLQSIVRLNSNGTVDSTFNVINSGFTGGFSPTVADIKLQPDGKLIAVGVFTAYKTNPSVNICRIEMASSPIPTSYNRVTFDYNGTDYIGSF